MMWLLACAAPDVGLRRGDAPLWDAEALPVFDVTLAADDWLAVLWADADATGRCGTNTYQRATVRFGNPATGAYETYEDVGVRLRGNASLDAAAEGNEHPGLKLSFSEFVEDGDLHGVEKIALLGTEGDFTLMREHFALAYARDAGLPAPRNAFALVYVNGALHGVMPYTEESDDGTYVDNHFLGVDGSLYKASGYCGDAPALLTWTSDDPSEYVDDYVPKAGTEDAAAADDLIPMLDCATNTTDAEFAACIPEWIFLDEWLALIALDQVLPDVDGLVGRAHNYMLFFDRGWDRFHVYPWDKDQAFYTHELTAASTAFDLDLVGGNEYKPLLVARLQTVFTDAYCAALRDTLARTEPARFASRAEALGQFLWDSVEADPRYDLTDWKYGVQGLIDGHTDHWEATTAQVAARCAAR